MRISDWSSDVCSSDLGVVALLVSMSAALVLSRFRDEGDAAARAMWLFSRNDALANVAVIVAAGLVAVTGEAWPDLLVVGVIALQIGSASCRESVCQFV